jgi:hypothetical protein
MAVVVYLSIGLAIVLLLLWAWATDRRTRSRGHHVSSGGDIGRDIREQKRDNKVIDAQGYLNKDRSWRYRPRRPNDRS